MRVVARTVARVARRERRPACGNSQLRVSLSTGCREPRLRQAQMDSGGLVVFGFLAALQHGTTIFLICEFLRFVHNESFTGLDLVGRQQRSGLLIFGDRTVDTFQQGYQVAAGHVGRGQTQSPAAERPLSAEPNADGGDEDKAGKAEDEEKGFGGEDPSQTSVKEPPKETAIVRGLRLRDVLPHGVVVVVVTLVARCCSLGCSLNRGLGGSIGILLGHRRSGRGAVGVSLGCNGSRRGAIGVLCGSSDR